MPEEEPIVPTGGVWQNPQGNGGSATEALPAGCGLAGTATGKPWWPSISVCASPVEIKCDPKETGLSRGLVAGSHPPPPPVNRQAGREGLMLPELCHPS